MCGKNIFQALFMRKGKVWGKSGVRLHNFPDFPLFLLLKENKENDGA
jgi:hypothetical protein